MIPPFEEPKTWIAFFKNLTFFDHYLLKTGNRVPFKGFFCVLKHSIVFNFFLFVCVYVYSLFCRSGSVITGLLATVYNLVAVTVFFSASSGLEFWVPHPIWTPPTCLFSLELVRSLGCFCMHISSDFENFPFLSDVMWQWAVCEVECLNTLKEGLCHRSKDLSAKCIITQQNVTSFLPFPEGRDWTLVHDYQQRASEPGRVI